MLSRTIHFFLPLIGLILISRLGFSQDVANPTIPEEYDQIYQLWNSQDKYFIIIAANKTSVPKSDMPFVKTNASLLSDALSRIGYKKLNDGILWDERASHTEVINILHQVSSELTPQSKLLIYYAGHGAVTADQKELWLQLYGENQLGAYHGISLAEIVKYMREEENFQGELVILIDSCFSGQGVISGELSLQDLGHGAILASAANDQESYVVTGIEGVDDSAFTYVLIKGLTDEWDELDEDHDGAINSNELQVFAEKKLKKLYNDKHIRSKMTPFGVSIPQAMLLAYRREKVKNWNSNFRSLYASVRIDFRDPYWINRQRVADARLKVASIQVSTEGNVLADKDVVEVPGTGTVQRLVVRLPEGKSTAPLRVSLIDSKGNTVSSQVVNIAADGVKLASAKTGAVINTYQEKMSGVKATLNVTLAKESIGGAMSASKKASAGIDVKSTAGSPPL